VTNNDDDNEDEDEDEDEDDDSELAKISKPKILEKVLLAAWILVLFVFLGGFCGGGGGGGSGGDFLIEFEFLFFVEF
jgi:hypothetical protein